MNTKKVSQLVQKIKENAIRWGTIAVTITLALIAIWGAWELAAVRPIQIKAILIGLFIGACGREWSRGRGMSSALQKIGLLSSIFWGINFLFEPTVVNISWLFGPACLYIGVKIAEVFTDFKILPISDPLYYLWAATSLLTVGLKSIMTPELWWILSVTLLFGALYCVFSPIMGKWAKPIAYWSWVILALVTLVTQHTTWAVALLLTGWTICVIQFSIDMLRLVFPPEEADS